MKPRTTNMAGVPIRNICPEMNSMADTIEGKVEIPDFTPEYLQKVQATLPEGCKLKLVNISLIVTLPGDQHAWLVSGEQIVAL